MFKNLRRELDRLSGTMQVAVPLEADPDGYADKECPSTTCLFQFKIHSDDWQAVVRREEVFCPSCRHSAPAQSWYTTEQIEAAKQYAVGSFVNKINGAIRADAAVSKRRKHRGSFLSITIEASGGYDALLVPIAAAEPMRLQATCDACGCRYSFVGAAYFCPKCGKNSASHTFAQTLRTIRTAAGIGDSLRAILDADDAEVMAGALLEKAMLDAVTSFQRLSEQLFEERTGAAARRNAFQNLEIGSDLWEPVIGVTYEQLLDAAALQQLRIFYQQRHLLAHQQGIVDADYLAKSGDTTYTVGQRLLVKTANVLEFADLIEQLGNALLSSPKH